MAQGARIYMIYGGRFQPFTRNLIISNSVDEGGMTPGTSSNITQYNYITLLQSIYDSEDPAIIFDYFQVITFTIESTIFP